MSFGWKLYIHQTLQCYQVLKKNRVSEYWNVYELIYNIENHLPNIDNPILSLIVF